MSINNINNPLFFQRKLPQRGLIPHTITSNDRDWLVSLDIAKEHLRIGHTDDDAYILRLTKSAQLLCEKLTGLTFTPMTFNLTCDNWEQTLEIPEVSAVSEIHHIKYYDSAIPSVFQTLPSAQYYLDFGSQRSRITLDDRYSYPDLRDGTGNIVVSFSTRSPWDVEDTTSFNEVAFQAVLITISDMYENRQSVIVGRIASSIPRTAQFLLDTLKIQTL
tara:strand:- start:66 stop:719 length:654 start_codon:yes stop_codon:yes gene_type:complete